jgi:hypothetical protein
MRPGSVGGVVANNRYLDRLRHRSTTTPGLLTLIGLGLVVAGLVSGLVSLVTVQRRADLVRDVGTVSGPLSVQAQTLYRSLSDADAAAARAFLANGNEPADVRQRYLDDIAQASAALTVGLRDAADGPAADKLAVVARELPTYTGLIETARAYNRQQIPLGAAYLREASGLMRRTLLPAAQQLFELEQTRLVAAQRDAATFPWAVLLLGLLVLAGLVAAQWLLVRRTNRVFNTGLVAASLALLIGCTWATVAVAGAAGDVATGRHDGSAQVRLLADARVAALQARADEALTLVARGDGAAFEQDFGTAFKALTETLTRARESAPNGRHEATVAQALSAASAWKKVHDDIRNLDNGGRYGDAVALATNTAADGPSKLFERLDAALTKGITDTNASFERESDDAADALAGVDIGVIVLTLLLVAGAAAGLQRRIGEYR